MMEIKVDVLEKRKVRLAALRCKYTDMLDASEDPVAKILIHSKIDELDISVAAIDEAIRIILSEKVYPALKTREPSVKKQGYLPVKVYETPIKRRDVSKLPAVAPMKKVMGKRRKKAPKKKDETLFQG